VQFQYLYLLSINRKKNKQTKKELFAFAQRLKMYNFPSDCWGTTCIGIDETTRYFFLQRNRMFNQLKFRLKRSTPMQGYPEKYKNGDSKTGQPSAQHIFLK
jgi:hypothetical protein